MPFPSTPLQVRVDLLIGGVWTDVTSDALARDAITITRGRADEASRAEASKCGLTFKNQAGKYSPRNPTSPYYRLLGRNTPLRVGIGVPAIGGAAALTAPGTSHIAPSVTAAQAGRLVGAWAASQVGNYTLPGSFTAGTEQDGAVATFRSGVATVAAAGPTGTSTATFSASPAYAAALQLFIPATVDVSSTFVTANSGLGTLLTRPVTAGNYLVALHAWSTDPNDEMQEGPRDYDAFTSAAWMLVADTGPSVGPRIKAYVRRVPATSAAMNCYFNGPADGTTSTFSRVYEFSGVTDYYPRFIGEVSAWPSRWDLSGRDVWVPVEASGIKRRLGQGASPLRSSLTRLLLSRPAVQAYWPMEDANEATSFASGLPGGRPMSFLGAPQLAADSGFDSSEALPTFTAAGAAGDVPVGVSTGQLFFGALISMPAAGTTDQATLLTAACSPPGVAVASPITSWTVKATAIGSLRIQAYDGTGATRLDQTVAFAMNGTRFYLYVTAQTNINNVDWKLWTVTVRPGDQVPDGLFFNGTIALATVAPIAALSVGTARDLSGEVTIGHVVAANQIELFNGISGAGDFEGLRALAGWISEPAGDRVRRLCKEEGIPVVIQAMTESALMGPQRPGRLLALLQECEVADDGVLFEPRGILGFAYRSRKSKYNQATGLTLDYAAGNVSAPFEPVDDDQGVVNDVTVTRAGGSSARAELTSGPLSVLPPPNGIGRYDDEISVNLGDDTTLQDQAAWRLAVGTWDEARWPSVRVDLAKNPALIPAAAAADVEDLLTVTGLLPSWVPPGPIDLVLEGYSETLGHPNDWDITANCSPGGPYRVLQADSATYGRADSATSTLAAGVTSTAGTFSVAVAAGSALWITTATFPAQFPFTAVVGGEEVTVTGITGTSSPQTWSVTRSANNVVKTHLAGAQIRLARPVVAAL